MGYGWSIALHAFTMTFSRFGIFNDPLKVSFVYIFDNWKKKILDLCFIYFSGTFRGGTLEKNDRSSRAFGCSVV